MSKNSFGARAELKLPSGNATFYRLDTLAADHPVETLPFCLKILLENLLRNEDALSVSADEIVALAGWDGKPPVGLDIAFTPARVLMQDFTGVPAVVDLAGMRDAVSALGGDIAKVNPLVPVELVIDHSVIAEVARRPDSFSRNAALELERNRERYSLLRWAQGAFENFVVVPPDTGICHQVNLEYLARVVFRDASGQVYPDTLVGTDSHTTMINGLGVLGWGVGGIEAEAAILGQPLSMVLPPVVGVRLSGELPQGSTATDLVLSIANRLRKHGVVGKFVEFYGPGLASVPLENRATIGNMSPEYGSTCAIFPIDSETLRYLSFTGRSQDQVRLVETYAKEQGLFFDAGAPEPLFTEKIEIDLSAVLPSISGPSRPQDLVAVSDARSSFSKAIVTARAGSSASATSQAGAGSSTPPGTEVGSGHGGGEPALRSHTAVLEDGTEVTISDGSVVIAAITSCTNTSNPQVMVAAGLLAKKALGKGLVAKPWVKTSLAPGSQVVTEYLDRAGLSDPLRQVGFELVGYGCTTCIGNSGPLLDGVLAAVSAGELSVSAVLSGNRNFEGRIHPDVRMNWLASPPLVVAYSLAGTIDIDLTSEPLGFGTDGEPVMMADIWPSVEEVSTTIRESLSSEMFVDTYSHIYDSDTWGSAGDSSGASYSWDDSSTYVRRPPFYAGLEAVPDPVSDIHGARVLAYLGDSVTTDHISPAGSIRPDTPAGKWLLERQVPSSDFNSYGARRGNHEVMIRGTFANVRLRNQLAPGTEGGWTRHLPDGRVCSIYEASEEYLGEGVPLVILAGKEYGSGSSRDWAAKGTLLLGVRAVLAESFERIHRSNLVGMGILPLEFPTGHGARSLGVSGEEEIEITGLEALNDHKIPETVRVVAGDVVFDARVRIDTAQEAEYFRHGGVLRYVARELAGG